MKTIRAMFQLSDDEYDYLVGLATLESLSLGFSMDEGECFSSILSTTLSNRLVRLMCGWKDFLCSELSEEGRDAELADVLERFSALAMEPDDIDGTTLVFKSQGPQSERDGEEEDVSSEAAPEQKAETVPNAEEASGPDFLDEDTPFDQNVISVSLTDEEMGKLVELVIAHNEVDFFRGSKPSWTLQGVLEVFLRCENLDEEIQLVRSLMSEEVPASGHADEEREDSGGRLSGPLLENRTDAYIYYLEHDVPLEALRQ